MTHFPEELIEAARAAYEYRSRNNSWMCPWAAMLKSERDEACQAFTAGLRAIPVSDEFIEAVRGIKGDTHVGFFTAAITYLAGDGK